MSKKSIDEGLLDWWKEFLKKDREIGIELSKRRKAADKEYALRLIDQAEKEWKRTLSKTEKNWSDKFLISNTGIHDESSLNAALDRARKDVDDVLDKQEKTNFFKFLLNMIGTLS
jgi:hypothetical protein